MALYEEPTVIQPCRSLLTYQGHKFRLIETLWAHLPPERKSFVDLFGGSGTVSINMVPFFDKVIYNERDYRVSRILEAFKAAKNPKSLIRLIDRYIKKYGMDDKTEDRFYEMREAANAKQDPILQWLCSRYAHSSMLRFNGNDEFNTSYAKDKRHFNQSPERDRDIHVFWDRLQKVKIVNRDYREWEGKLDNASCAYFDPPYLVSGAMAYQGGWTRADELALLDFMEGVATWWMLSNMTEHRGKANKPLRKWLKKHKFNVNHVGGSELYKFSNIEGSNDKKSVEILATNY